MSKRKLLEVVNKGYVRGWDDPRLYTLVALRRRGIPPGALLSFINELGVTTAQSLIQIPRLEQSIRRYLERTVPRLMMVLDPLPVVIEDFDSVETEKLDLNIPFSPKDPKVGSHALRMTKTVYIDRSDFREEDSKGYFRLAPGKAVGLLQAPFPIKATSFTKDAEGEVTEVRAVFSKDGPKVKTYIQWVPEGSRKVEVRIHDPLFKSDDPTAAEGGFLNDINPNSETIYSEALIDGPGFEEVRRRAPWPEEAGERDKSGPESVRFQALRVAYFVSGHWPFSSIYSL
jgi:glutaminyl-tRNA synthetase